MFGLPEVATEEGSVSRRDHAKSFRRFGDCDDRNRGALALDDVAGYGPVLELTHATAAHVQIRSGAHHARAVTDLIPEILAEGTRVVIADELPEGVEIGVMNPCQGHLCGVRLRTGAHMESDRQG